MSTRQFIQAVLDRLPDRPFIEEVSLSANATVELDPLSPSYHFDPKFHTVRVTHVDNEPTSPTYQCVIDSHLYVSVGYHPGSRRIRLVNHTSQALVVTVTVVVHPPYSRVV